MYMIWRKWVARKKGCNESWQADAKEIGLMIACHDDAVRLAEAQEENG